ncbi:MAG: hypothetical protein JXB26_01510 [Candidatus Aminicenantes bacterium]|nr:hypothetical protein [Candidatus Aminicenantes bacterium]
MKREKGIRKIQDILPCLLILLLSFPAVWAEEKRIGPVTREIPGVDLDKILSMSAAYCSALTEAALDFVCLEKIEERMSKGNKKDDFFSGRAQSPPPNVQDNNRILRSKHPMSTPKFYRKKPRPREMDKNFYIYDYQLIKEENSIREKRTLVEENGRKIEEKDVPLKAKRFYSKRAVFGPVGLLSREQQKNYRYSVIGEGRIGDRNAIIIEAIPIKISEENPNYGKIWIEKKSGAVLRIDVAQDSILGLEDLNNTGLRRKVILTHFYGIEKKGLRFPSRTVFKENIWRDKSEDFEITYSFSMPKRSLYWVETVIEYTDYRFFNVSVNVNLHYSYCE